MAGKDEISTTYSVNGGGNSPSGVLVGNAKDLEPQSEALAVAGGAVAGGAVGASSLFAGDMIPGGTKAKIAIIAATAAVGATISYLKTHTHNKWSDRVAKSTLDKGQGVQVG
jgi:hypothetical protein